jgi:hypothetical protein
MTIDDPVQALLQQMAAARRDRHPVTEFVLDFGKAMVSAAVALPGLSKLADRIDSFLKADGRDNQMLLVLLVSEELRSVQDRLRKVQDDHKQFLHEEFPGLLLNAFKRVEWVRSKTRIQRLAKVLRAAVMEGPARSADETEEYMRVTMELGEEDILVLSALCDYKVQGDSALKSMSEFRVAGVQPEDMDSVLSKLQSYGLVAFVPDQIIGAGGPDYPFRVLPRGRKFLSAISVVADNT